MPADRQVQSWAPIVYDAEVVKLVDTHVSEACVARHAGSSPAFGTMIVVYAIRSLSRNYVYVGLTNDLERRLNEHNQRYNKTTKPYAPFELIYQEKFPDRISARRKEKQLKSGIGKEFLKAL